VHHGRGRVHARGAARETEHEARQRGTRERAREHGAPQATRRAAIVHGGLLLSVPPPQRGWV
jgi:hypothetical protein